MRLVRELYEYSWVVLVYDTSGGALYRFISLDSIGITKFEHTDYVPLENLKQYGFVLPYPDPFSILTVPEAVYQKWMRDIIVPRIKNIKLKNVIQDSSSLGPIYIEEYIDTDELKDIRIEHSWIIFNSISRYTIDVSYNFK